jgi:uncharacterized membrane protein (DUF4010 family)
MALFMVKNHETQLHDNSIVRHPLELSTAVLFAVSFMLFAFLTNYVTTQYGGHGLKSLAIVVGFTDIDPFILSLLSGKFTVSNSAIVSAVILASGSNNVLKAIYAVAAGWLIFLFLVSLLYTYHYVW